MDRVTLSESAFEKLVKHLVEIEESKKKLLEQYFATPSKERYEFKEAIEDYIKRIDQLLINANKSRTSGNEVPFVTIECEVELQDLSLHEVFKYRITNPLHERLGEGDISCLSPVGKSLLLKKVNDVIVVNAPGGVFRYKILSIQLQNHSEIGSSASESATSVLP